MEGSLVELTQNIETPNPKSSSKGYGKQSPKTKAKAKARSTLPAVDTPVVDPGWDMDPEDFMLVRTEEFADQPDIQHLESRMLNMENALTQVIAHLEKITVNMDAAAPSKTT